MLTTAKEKAMGSSDQLNGQQSDPFDDIVNKKYQKEVRKVRKEQLSSLVKVLENGVNEKSRKN